MGTPSTPRRPLAITADEHLLDDLVRLAAAAGITLDVAHDAGAARRWWPHAPLILVGADAVPELAWSRPSRRPDVVVVARDLADDRELWEGAIAIGAEQVVRVADAEQRLVTWMADAAEGIRSEAVTVGVVGGRGGAGASTLAAALAVTAARHDRGVLLVDGDPLGGGIDLILGGEEHAGMRWPDLVATEGRVGASALRAALPSVERLAVLSWDRSDALAVPPAAMRAVLGAARRGGDLVVVDLPPQLDGAATEALSLCETVLVVVPAEVRAVAAASRVVKTFAQHAADLRLVVRGPSPAGLDGTIVADALGLPLAGELAPEPRLAIMLERGEAPARRGKGPLAVLCRRLLGELGVLQHEGHAA